MHSLLKIILYRCKILYSSFLSKSGDGQTKNRKKNAEKKLSSETNNVKIKIKIEIETIKKTIKNQKNLFEKLSTFSLYVIILLLQI